MGSTRPPVSHDPDEPRHRLHRLEDAVEHRGVERRLAHVASGKAGNLIHEGSDLLAGPVDLVRFVDAHGKYSTHRHCGRAGSRGPAPPATYRSGLGGLLVNHPLLHVGLECAEGLLVTGDGVAQGIGEPLGCEEVHDDPLGELDRFGTRAANLLVEAEVDDQLLGRAGDAAEVRVGSEDVRLVDGHVDGFGAGGLRLVGHGNLR